MLNGNIFKCIKSFKVDKWSDDIFSEKDFFQVKQGYIFEKIENSFEFDVILQNENFWIKIPKDSLKEYFECI